MTHSDSILYYYYNDVGSVIEEHFAKALASYRKAKGLSPSPFVSVCVSVLICFRAAVTVFLSSNFLLR